jgi:hypothetical protein
MTAYTSRLPFQGEAKLREAVLLAQRDWRDVLVLSGFGDDVHAHEAWMPSTTVS